MQVNTTMVTDANTHTQAETRKDRETRIEKERDRKGEGERERGRQGPARKVKKRWSGEQVELAQRRQLEAFKSSIPSLQVAASFACSVASLSRSPAFQLPGHHHLHGEVLADHQFDWGGLSTC